MNLYLIYEKEVNFILFVVLFLLLVAMILDLCYHRISNRYLLIIWPFGLLYRITLEGGSGLYRGVILSLIPIILLYFLYHMRALGAGDVKLFAAVGVYLTLEQLIEWILCSFLCGAVIGGVMLIRRKILIRQIRYFGEFIKEQLFLFPNQRIYQNARIGQDNVIHFTIAMVTGYCLILWRGL